MPQLIIVVFFDIAPIWNALDLYGDILRGLIVLLDSTNLQFVPHKNISIQI